MRVMKAVGQRGTWLVFASVAYVAISGGCVADESISQTDTSLTACICPLEVATLDSPQAATTTTCLTGCGFCGDGLCSGSETAFSCPSDCGPVCGDGFCEAGESSSSCPTDCGPVCGNGVCESGESSTSCSTDCGPPPPPPTACGNDICKDAFSVTSAQAQARYAWAASCRISQGGTRPAIRYLSDQSVTTYNAASASLQPYLFPIYLNALTSVVWNVPDGAGTNCSLLPSATTNTALCVAGCIRTPVCGNGACESGESASSCPADCGPVCGNGLCESGESASSCPTDCGHVCGNGLCELGESSLSCPDDCGFRCLGGPGEVEGLICQIQ